MRDGIHPDYGPIVFWDSSAETGFLTRSTIRSDATIQWSDGQTYPVVRVDISALSHPFWTGTQRVLDTAGQVEKFRRRYGDRTAQSVDRASQSGDATPCSGDTGPERSA